MSSDDHGKFQEIGKVVQLRSIKIRLQNFKKVNEDDS